MTLWIHKISTALVLVIGGLHLVGAFFKYDHLSLASFLFAGAALGILFVALLNVNLWSSTIAPMTRRTAAAANFLFFFWCFAGIWTHPDIVTEIAAGIGMTMVISATFLRRPAKS